MSLAQRMTRIATLSLALCATALPGISQADPPPWAPAHGYRAKHEYIYYPSHQIYYEPARSLWFWLDGGDWRFGVDLPVYYRQYTRGGVTVVLDAERPYERHDYVVEHYGGPRRVEHHYHDSRPTRVDHYYYHDGRDDGGHKHRKHKHKKHKHHD